MNAVLYIGEFSGDLKGITRDNCLTLQKYSYSCERSLNDASIPFGPWLTTIINFTIRLLLPDDSKVFHERMRVKDAYSYTFLYDPKFSDTDGISLKDYSLAMLVKGHVIDVEESFDASIDATGTSKQVEVHVKLLLDEIVYVGGVDQNNNLIQKKLVLRQDESTLEDTKTYALFIDQDTPDSGIKNGITFTTGQVITINESWNKSSSTINGSDKYLVTKVTSIRAFLKTLKYHKKIYQPNKIDVTMSLVWQESKTMTYQVYNQIGRSPTLIKTEISDDPPSFETLKAGFLNKKVGLKLYDKLNSIDKIIAKNYFIYQMNPCYRKNAADSTIDLELHIYSLDKLLTLDKYSKAYTAQRLGTDIFTPELKNFKVGNLTVEGDTSKMQFLNLTTSAKEMRLPYVVQYNETFYDFMKRISQRYGEFLYHEDGKLRLGMELADTNYWLDKTNNKIKDWASCKDLKVRYYQSFLPEALTVEDEYSAYNERTDDNSVVYSPRKTKENDVITIHFYNPDPVSSDEYLVKAKKDGATSYNKQMHDWKWTRFMEDLYKALGASSLAGILSNLSITWAFRAIKAAKNVKDMNEWYNEENIKPYEGDSYKDQRNNDDKEKFTEVSLFSSFENNTAFSAKLGNEVVNFSSEFYQTVRNMEKSVTGKAVFLEFGDHTQLLSLGDKIHVDGTDYVIVEIEGQSEKEKDAFNDIQKVAAIPLYQYDSSTILVPPVIPIPLIRESKPQRAFVAVNMQDPEKLGRVRVRYPWQDPDDAPTPWIRVTVPMATNGGSVNFRPEVGDEVMVSYVDGNIDKPYVTGYLISPYIKQTWGAVIPDRGIMSKNGHALTFDDGLDGLNFLWGWLPLFNTFRDFIPDTDWTDNFKVTDRNKASQKMVDLTGGVTLTDRYGLYKISGSSDGRNITLQSPMGDVKINAFTGITISAPNGDITIAGKNVNIKAGNKLTLTSGSNINDRFISKKSFFTQGDGFLDRALGTVEDIGLGLLNGVSKKAEEMLDLSFLRTVLEVFMRPIDGTLKIKSTTFVMVEAGPGKVEVPRGSYAKNPKDYMSDADYENKTHVYTIMSNTLATASMNIVDLVNNLKKDEEALVDAIHEFKDWQQNNPGSETIINFNEIRAIAQGNDATLVTNTLEITDGDIHADADVIKDPDPLPEDDSQKPEEPKQDSSITKEMYKLKLIIYKNELELWEKAQQNRKLREDERNQKILENLALKMTAIQKATSLLRKMHDLKRSANSWRNLVVTYPDSITEALVYKPVLDYLKDTAELSNNFPITVAKSLNLTVEDTLAKIAENTWEKEKKILKRKIAYQLLQENEVKSLFKIKDNITEPTDYENDQTWTNFVGGIYINDITFISKAKDWAIEHYVENFTDLRDVFTKNKLWDSKVKGQILFSDNPTKTVAFARKGMNEQSNMENISSRFEAEIKRMLGDVK
jgi:hypothetical protein